LWNFPADWHRALHPLTRGAERRAEFQSEPPMRVSGCCSVFHFVFTRGRGRLMPPLGRVMELGRQVEPPVPAVGAALLRPSRISTDTDTACELCSALTILFRFPCARGRALMMVPAPIELPGQSDNTPVESNTDRGLTRSLSLEFPG
ncbi:MAG TPA: hypothetical protein VMF32_23855, partial [Xanthobacteraceae bacterium]|nr:hypothetical protein [Xanthobacteraceae bacterium]